MAPTMACTHSRCSGSQAKPGAQLPQMVRFGAPSGGRLRGQAVEHIGGYWRVRESAFALCR